MPENKEKLYCSFCTFWRGHGVLQPCDESGKCPTCTGGPAYWVPLRSIQKETSNKIAESVKTIMRHEKAIEWYRKLLAQIAEQEKQDAEQNARLLAQIVEQENQDAEQND